MIEYCRTNNKIPRSISLGEGKIINPSNISYLEASYRELETILLNAPFLVESKGKRTIQTFTNHEAVAAALAFNFTEK